MWLDFSTVNIFLRLTIKILSFLRLTAKFLAVLRLTVNPIETLVIVTVVTYWLRNMVEQPIERVLSYSVLLT